MLRDVSYPTRIMIASIVLVGATAVASVASAASFICEAPADCEPAAVSATHAERATPGARPAAVHPTAAASYSTRRVTHDAAAHHRRHPRTHHTEPNLRAHEVTAASLPARVPARPRVPRSSHRASAPALGHRDGGTRTSGAAGVPVSAAGALSIAVLGTCVHQRTRDRLRSLSQPLESRGPPRAGPHATLASRRTRGAREFTVGASAPHPPLGGSHNSRVSPSPLRVPPHLAPPLPACAPLERRFPPLACVQAAARDARSASAPACLPVFRCTGAPGPTWSARSRASALRCRPLDPEESR